MDKDRDLKFFVRKPLQEASKVNAALKKVIEDFKAYKKGFHTPAFGREAPFHDPRPAAEQAELMHIHLLSNKQIKHLRVAKINSSYRKTSDSFLVYTVGFLSSNKFYLIDYIENGAHSKTKDMDYMRWLISQAESFRKSH